MSEISATTEARLHIVVPLALVHRVDEAVLARRKMTGRAVSRNATINELLAHALAAEEENSTSRTRRPERR